MAKQSLDGSDVVGQPLLGGAEESVLDDMGRYTHRVGSPASVSSAASGWAQSDPASGKKRTLRLPGTEFIGRSLQHVLPSGFKRILHHGLVSPAKKKDTLAAARAALAVPPLQPAVIESVAEFLRCVSLIEHARCPHCGSGQFRVIAVIAPQPCLPHSRGPP